MLNEAGSKEILTKKKKERVGNCGILYYMFFQECESSLKQKTELIGRLEAKAAEMAETIRNLEAQYVFQGPQSSNDPSQVGHRARSKSYYGSVSNNEGDEKEEGEGHKGVGKSLSMSELQNRATGDL